MTNLFLIQHTLDLLQTFDVLKTLQATPLKMRELDGRIAFSVFSRPMDETSYGRLGENNVWPYALVMDSPRSRDAFHLPKDIVEFENPYGNGWIMMAEAKVPHYTSSFDAAFGLWQAHSKWSISETGLVKAQCLGNNFKQKLLTPQLSICAIGLMIQLKFHKDAESLCRLG